MNNIIINRQDLNDMDGAKLKQKFNMDKYENKEGFMHIVKSREVMKRVMVASVCRFTVGFVYYGLMINSVSLPVMSFPGEIIALYLMNKVGRKTPLILGYLFSGLMCVVSAYVQTTWAKIALYLVGKMIISACFTGIITYTMELYPTSARGTLTAFGAFTSRVGAMLAPLTPMLIQISPALPSIFFGGSAVISGLLLALTPETKELPLMDTIEQVEANTRTARRINTAKIDPISGSTEVVTKL